MNEKIIIGLTFALYLGLMLGIGLYFYKFINVLYTINITYNSCN